MIHQSIKILFTFVIYCDYSIWEEKECSKNPDDKSSFLSIVKLQFVLID